MKNRLLNSFFRAAAAFALLLAAGACKDDVALPMQRVALNTHAILAPSFATTLSFDVEANCDWTISVAGDDNSRRPRPRAWRPWRCPLPKTILPAPVR